MENLLAAWREFRRGKMGRADVQAFAMNSEDNLFSLHDDLVAMRYAHGSYERFSMCDPKPRIIHKATVRDRVLHHAVYRLLAPEFDTLFIEDSYSCQVGKGTHAGVRRLQEFVRVVSAKGSRPCWALKLDIEKFFASVDQRILLHRLSGIRDERVLRLLRTVITSFPPVHSVTKGGGGITRAYRSATSPRSFLRTCIFIRSISL